MLISTEYRPQQERSPLAGAGAGAGAGTDTVSAGAIALCVLCIHRQTTQGKGRQEYMSKLNRFRGFYVCTRLIRKSIRIRTTQKRRLVPEEAMEYQHISALFSHLVIAACKRHNVTPQTATGAEFSLDELMLEAESMLGYVFANVTDEERRRRRQYAYSSFIRSTSAGVRL